MRILLPVIALTILSFKSNTPAKNTPGIYNDSTAITHLLDGKVNEWPTARFEEDKSTHIKLAVDNDAQNLYVAMVINSFPVQAKLMRQGMNLYVDIKGKKKEGKGIEFPVKSESDNSTGFRQASNGSQGGFDKQAFRSAMAMNLLSLKVFGFSDADAEKQALDVAGSVNVQFSWDDQDVMYIEYNIPLSLLGDKTSELSQKAISMGWKINGMDQTNQSPQVTRTALVGVNTTTGDRKTINLGPSQNNQNANRINFDNDAMKEQSFWTKYTFLVAPK